MKQRLTDTIIDRLKPDGVLVWDAKTTGLGVRRGPRGLSFCLNYSAVGKQRRITLKAMNLSDARAEAETIRAEVQKTRRSDAPYDPLALREAEQRPEIQTIKDLADYWLDVHAAARKRPISIRGDKGMLRKYILPAFGGYRLDELKRHHIEVLLNRIGAQHPFMANRVHSLITTILKYGVDNQLLAMSPAKGLKKPFKEKKRVVDRSPDEIRRLFAALDAHPNQDKADVVRLLLFTGSRRNEILHAPWSEFKLDSEMWSRPAERNKGKEPVDVALNPETMAILRRRRAADPSSEFLFPSRLDRTRPASIGSMEFFWKTILKRAELKGLRIHDCRHIFARRALNAGANHDQVAELLGQQTSGMAKRYAKWDHAVLKARSTAASAALMGMVKPAEIIDLSKARKARDTKSA